MFIGELPEQSLTGLICDAVYHFYGGGDNVNTNPTERDMAIYTMGEIIGRAVEVKERSQIFQDTTDIEKEYQIDEIIKFWEEKYNENLQSN